MQLGSGIPAPLLMGRHAATVWPLQPADTCRYAQCMQCMPPWYFGPRFDDPHALSRPAYPSVLLEGYGMIASRFPSP
ncbi:hypothetical protein IG631_12267 [Alternaria alternata]|nr:hypothetical protein IG631_12267 [Alternaria alternata]